MSLGIIPERGPGRPRLRTPEEASAEAKLAREVDEETPIALPKAKKQKTDAAAKQVASKPAKVPLIEVDPAILESAKRVIEENRQHILGGAEKEDSSESEEEEEAATEEAAAEDADEPLTIFEEKPKKEKVVVTLDSDDNEELVLAPKKAKREMDIASIPFLSAFVCKDMELHTSGNFYNLSLNGNLPRFQLDAWTQVNAPLRILSFQGVKKDFVEVAIELSQAAVEKVVEFDTCCGKLFRKLEGKRAVPWRRFCDPAVVSTSRETGLPVPTMVAKLNLAKTVVIVSREGKIRIGQGMGLEFFEEHVAKFQNVRVRGVLEFSSVYEIKDRDNFAGLAKPVFRHLCIDVLPKKALPLGSVSQPSLSKKEMQVLMGLK